MSLVNSEHTYSSGLKSDSFIRDSQSYSDSRSESSQRINPDGFSSSLVLKFEETPDQAPKFFSKLINITQLLPDSSKVKKIMLPVFYRKEPQASPKKLYLESSFSGTPSGDSVHDCPLPIKNDKVKGVKNGKVTSTTFGSMHTLSNLDGDVNHEIFSEKVNYEYENELKSSICEGNFFAYCDKCKKETVCVVRPEKSKNFFDFLFCCCNSWNTNIKTLVCPTCSEILTKK